MYLYLSIKQALFMNIERPVALYRTREIFLLRRRIQIKSPLKSWQRDSQLSRRASPSSILSITFYGANVNGALSLKARDAGWYTHLVNVPASNMELF
jgi:hypothetical protein